MSAETELAVGADFLGYRIEEELARGGMGVVYRAYDQRLKRTVALKFVAPELAHDARFRERFLRELEVAASLEHPNVVPIHDAGENEGRVYLAMRHVEGTTLGKLLRAEGPLDPARALAICSQVARALDAAHERGLVHRDVKPSNVLLDGAEHVYLADFGLARRTDEGALAADGRSIGTPAYVAPEQLAGEHVDGRVDVYALGCLLFECLAGAPPFAHASPLGVAWSHLEDEPPEASKHNAVLPTQLDPVIAKAMAKQPDDRYATCGEFIAAAESALGLRERRTRRTPWLMAAAAVAAVAAIAVLVGLATVRGDRAPSALFGAPDTLVRVDPRTNAVSAVIPVGAGPGAVASSGSLVWVHNTAGASISEVDARTNRVRRTVHTGTSLHVGPRAGPTLAADSRGAWLIALDASNREALFHVGSDGRRVAVHRLRGEPHAIATGFGDVWIVTREGTRSVLLRVDGKTADVAHAKRTTFPLESPVDSISAAYGYVWAASSSSAVLYRIDPRTGVRRKAALPEERGRRPRPMGGLVWVGMTAVDPRSLTVAAMVCCPVSEEAGALDAIWRLYPASGTIVRVSLGPHRGMQRAIRLVSSPPEVGGPCLSSVASGAGALWVTVASPGLSPSSCEPREDEGLAWIQVPTRRSSPADPGPFDPSLPRNGDWIAYSTAPASDQVVRPGSGGAPPTGYGRGSDVFVAREGGSPRLVASRGDGTTWNVCPAFSPDGTRLAFGTSSPRGRAIRVVRFSRAGDIVAPRIHLGIRATGPAPCPRWSSDGKRIAYVGAGKVVVRGLDGSTGRPRKGDPTIGDFTHRPDDPVASPSRQRTARASSDGATCRVTVARGSGSIELELEFCPYAVAGWSPDGRKVLVMLDVSGRDFTMFAVSVEARYAAVPIVEWVGVNHARSWPRYGDVSWQPAAP